MAARRERTQSDRSAQPVRGRTTGGLGRPGGTDGEGDVACVGGEGGPVAVEACDLRKSFPTPGGEPIEILHGISCAMMPGRMTALVGPSGSGKSTALLCLAGLEPATSGRVSLMGRDLGGLPAARVAELYRDRVGFVFQAYNLVPYLTVRENITISDTPWPAGAPTRRGCGRSWPGWDWSRALTRSRPRSRAVSSSASP